MLINNLKSRIDAFSVDIKKATDRVIESGWLVLGPEVKRFEEAFAIYLGARICIGVANGTDALELALRALDVEAGSRVATVANAGMYTTTALLAIGAEPVFMDVNLESRNVELKEIERVLGLGVRAVVVTHLYGLAVADIDAIAARCAERGVPLVEDCAQAHGATFKGRRVGTFGDVASFSFYPTKNLGALGDGGAVVTSSDAIAEKVKRLRQYGWNSKYKVEHAGGRNSRLDEIQAAILMVFLPHLDAENARRREIAARYGAGIRHPEVLLPSAASVDSVMHLYVVRSIAREALRAHLHECGVGSDVHYPIPDHRQPVFRDRFKGLSLENTERLAAEVLTLPCYPQMSNEEIDQVVAAVNAWQP